MKVILHLVLCILYFAIQQNEMLCVSFIHRSEMQSVRFGTVSSPFHHSEHLKVLLDLIPECQMIRALNCCIYRVFLWITQIIFDCHIHALDAILLVIIASCIYTYTSVIDFSVNGIVIISLGTGPPFIQPVNICCCFSLIHIHLNSVHNNVYQAYYDYYYIANIF